MQQNPSSVAESCSAGQEIQFHNTLLCTARECKSPVQVAR